MPLTTVVAIYLLHIISRWLGVFLTWSQISQLCNASQLSWSSRGVLLLSAHHPGTSCLATCGMNSNFLFCRRSEASIWFENWGLRVLKVQQREACSIGLRVSSPEFLF